MDGGVLAAPEGVGLLEAATFVITRRSKATSKFERLKLRLVYSDLQKNPPKGLKGLGRFVIILLCHFALSVLVTR